MRDKYHIKQDKKAFLYPKQFKEFYNKLTEHQQVYFKIVINTGARINEILNLTPNDISLDRNQLTFLITKVRHMKKETRPEPRTIQVSAEFKSWIDRYIKRNNLKKDEKIVKMSAPGIHLLIKRKLKDISLGNYSYKDFSSHNFRKTHGNWLKAIGIPGEEIASRLGHDMNTMLRHYVSPTLFNVEDRILIVDELGDLYSNLRKV